MTDSTTIREAAAADIPDLVACASALFREDGAARDPSINAEWPAQHGAASFTEGLADPGRLLLVADRGGRTVGYLTARISPGNAIRPVTTATLVSMWVSPEARGEGVGGRLVDHFKAWASVSEASHVEVTAHATNADAIRFYERHGFAAAHVTLGAELRG